MAFKRAMSNASAFAIGLALETDLTTTTVTNWEIRARAALLASARHFHQEQREAIKEMHKKAETAETIKPFVTISMMAVRGDATNATVWQKSKLHTTEAARGFITDPVCSDSEWEWALSAMRYKKELGDLQVCGRTDAPSTHALVVKQIVSSGGTAWTDRILHNHLALQDGRERLPAPIVDAPVAAAVVPAPNDNDNDGIYNKYNLFL